MVQQNVDSGYLENDEVDEMIMQRIEERTLYGLEFQLVNNHESIKSVFPKYIQYDNMSSERRDMNHPIEAIYPSSG